MKYDRLWERLIEYLSEWASVREVTGGIEVTIEESASRSRTVEMVLTPGDWDDFVSTIYGHGDPAKTNIKDKVLAVPDGVPYLVYDTYDWQASETRELPDVDFDPGPGEWVVTDDKGNVVSRFADFIDEHD